MSPWPLGELAEGLEIDLNKVPKKYEGLDGTELAISESQERMAVVVEEKDAARFMELADQENLRPPWWRLSQARAASP